MKTVSSTIISDDVDAQTVLKSAVQMACDELIQVHQVDEVEIALLTDTIALAILEKFRDGHRNVSLLAAYAAMTVLQHLGRKLH